ncbi:gamma-glutamylcyclotransferase family protein [Maridesulfovibrio sp.]|uniref:gamma-glutamylcyclotransferase family protein n=1 Tax=Maridesulfovibrio sp. TaxID=2795000 RepID=UPI0039EE7393
MKNKENHPRLFVYGSLKKGFWNFDRFYTRAISIEPATTWARSTSYPQNSRTQNTTVLHQNTMTRQEGDWNLVHGELMTFANPGFDLPPIDRLEAFAPNGRFIRGFWRWLKPTT